MTVAAGAKYSLYTFFMAVVNPGDEVIIPTPYWVSYGDQVKMAEGVPVFVSAKEDNHFKVTVEQLEAARTDKTKVLVLNSPSNPTGMIYTREELLAIGNWAVENDILILADDIYTAWFIMVMSSHRFLAYRKRFASKQWSSMVCLKPMP